LLFFCGCGGVARVVEPRQAPRHGVKGQPIPHRRCRPAVRVVAVSWISKLCRRA
jgi:hypothetical protein